MRLARRSHRRYRREATMRGTLQGFITEQQLDEAEAEFPGICRFFAESVSGPCTFLELVWQYEAAKREVLAQ
jgi:hypothetical protein